MTGIEIALVVIIAVCAVALLATVIAGGMALSQWLLDRKRQRQRQPDFTISDISLQATRNVVLVGQNTDVRFFFTVKNPRGLDLRYEADVKVDELADVQPQVNSFRQNHFRTFMPRLHCSWNSVGTKNVTATLEVFYGNAPKAVASAAAMGPIEVVAKLDEAERPV